MYDETSKNKQTNKKYLGARTHVSASEKLVSKQDKITDT